VNRQSGHTGLANLLRMRILELGEQVELVGHLLIVGDLAVPTVR
jgi:hypothetical protein